MSEKVLSYEGKHLTVTYDLRRCIHAAECVHAAPEVFDPNAKPWVNPDQATATRLVDAIERCPTGALHYARRDGGQAEQPAAKNTVDVTPDGPLYVRGRIEILDAAGATVSRETRAALCRCGASGNKPFCDGSHEKAGFEDAAGIGAATVKSDKVDTADGVLRIKILKAGPLQLQGPFDFHGAQQRLGDCNESWLCRCGSSNNKPFCDGTHKKVGFTG
jgi:CDGSH-type Zn-finger protein/uncharacterized Fe-S cluster protein YjdI